MKIQSNAIQVAKYLSNHPKIEKVIYPLLEDHEQYQIHKKQARGFTGVITFYLKGDFNKTLELINKLQIIKWATSFGSVETTIDQYYDTVTKQKYFTKEYLDKFGITENMIRMSVGIENISDLIYDFTQALEQI